MKVLVDVNLSPAWTGVLADHPIAAVHWTSVGDPRAADAELMRYAKDHGYVVFTHDLDFGTSPALTRARGPSVVQVRTQNVPPEAIGEHEKPGNDAQSALVPQVRSGNATSALVHPLRPTGSTVHE